MRTLVHLSDLHFGRIDPALVEPLRRAVVEVKPDLVAISGDFTQRARRSQFAAARAFIESLNAKTLVVPGNHDIPLYDVVERFAAPLARYRQYISDELEPEYRDEEMIVVGVNTARSLVFPFGEGRISERQVDRIVAAAVDAAARRSCASSSRIIRSICRPASTSGGCSGAARWRWRGSAAVERRSVPVGSPAHQPRLACRRSLRSGRAFRADRPGRHGIDARPRRAAVIQRAAHAAPGDRVVAIIRGMRRRASFTRVDGRHLPPQRPRLDC